LGTRPQKFGHTPSKIWAHALTNLGTRPHKFGYTPSQIWVYALTNLGTRPQNFGYTPSQIWAHPLTNLGTRPHKFSPALAYTMDLSLLIYPKTVTGSIKQCVFYYELFCTHILNIKETIFARLQILTAIPKTLPVFRDVTLCRLANSYRLLLGCWILKVKHCTLPKRR
jgi:hypothetical protein